MQPNNQTSPPQPLTEPDTLATAQLNLQIPAGLPSQMTGQQSVETSPVPPEVLVQAAGQQPTPVSPPTIPQGEIAGRASVFAMGTFLFFLLIFFPILTIVTVVVTFATVSHLTLATIWGIAIPAFFIAGEIYTVILLRRFPLKTVLNANLLTIYSLRGKHSVDLSAITNQKQVILLPMRGVSDINCLKLTDASGKFVYVSWRTIPRKERELFDEPLARALKMLNIPSNNL